MPRNDLAFAQQPGRSPLNAEEAARGAFVKIGPAKRILIRGLEMLFSPFVYGSRILGRPKEPETAGDVQRILVVEYWNLGDIVLLLPFLQGLRSGFPGARISLLVNPSVLPLLEGQDLVDELILARVPWAQHFSRWKKYNPFSPLWFSFFRKMFALRRTQFDLALTGRMDFRDNLITWLIGAKRRVGYNVGGGGEFLTDVVVPDLCRPHRSAVWLGLLEHLGKQSNEGRPRLRLSPREREFAELYLAERGIRESDFVLGIHPGARVPTRRWGDENFAWVAERLGSQFRIQILWFLDPNAKESGNHMPAGSVPVALPFRQFMAVLSRCNLLICNDSGPMHIASALGAPVVAIFGPQKPEWFGPLGNGNRVVIRPEFWCRPCFDYCIFDQPYCIKAITTDEVLQAAIAAVKDHSDKGDRG